MTNKIAFINGKGGCGKTTSIFHIAGVLSRRGEKVLVIDLDKQRNSTDTLLMEADAVIDKTVFDFMKGTASPEEITQKALFRQHGNAKPQYYGVDVMPADSKLEDEKLLSGVDIRDELNSFIAQQGYAWVLVDMPPSNKAINEICLTQIVDYVIVPYSPDFYSASGYKDLISIVERAREVAGNLKILGVYFARYKAKSSGDQFVKSNAQLPEDMLIDVQIPDKREIRDVVLFGRPLSYYYYKKEKYSDTRQAYEMLVEAIEERIKRAEVAV